MNAGLCRSCLSITSVHSNESHARRLFHPQEIAAVRISSIESIRTEDTIEAGPDSKSVQLDILCSSENGNYYDIEMQAQDTGELPKRSRYYSSMMAFLDYVGGKPASRSDDSYVQQIDRAVRRAKKNAVWRKQYMDWEMEKKEIEWTARKEGRAEGLAEGEAKGKAENLAENIKILAAYLKSLDDSLTMEQAMRRASEILQSKNV